MSLFANTTGYLLAAAVIAVVIAVLVVLYLKFRKGSLQIQLDQRSVQVGETISGTLCVVSKQDLLADRITVSITCTEHWETEEWDHNANDGEGRMTTNRHSREAFHREYEIAGDVTLAANSRQNIPLQVEIPGHVGYHSVGIEFRWTLKARVHMKGLDLSKSQRIRVLYPYR